MSQNTSIMFFLYHTEDLKSGTVKEVLENTALTASASASGISNESLFLGENIYTLAQLDDKITNFERRADYLNYIRTAQDIERYDFTYNAEVVESEISSTTAHIRIYTAISYKYTPDSYETTFECDYYSVWLAKINGLWCIANIYNEATATESSDESARSYEELIAQFDAWQERKVNVSTTQAVIASGDAAAETMAVGTYDRLYNADNAVAYAYTYTTGSYTDSQNNDFYLNKSFNNLTGSGGNCQNFVSQSVWSGFGGCDTEDAINLKRFPMDTSTSHPWWSIKGDASPSWKACDLMRGYLRTCNNSSSSLTGMITNYTSDSANECSTSFAELGMGTGTLYGSMLYVNKNSSGYAHVVLIVGANGTNFDQVYFCGNSPMRKWKKLSDEYIPNPSFCVVKPSAMKDGRGCSHSFPGSTNFCSRCGYNRMKVTPTMVRPIAQNTTLSVGGRANITCFRMALCITSPSGDNTWRELTSTSSIYSSYYFNQTGLYTIKIVARDLDPDSYPSATRTAENVFKIRVY